MAQFGIYPDGRKQRRIERLIIGKTYGVIDLSRSERGRQHFIITGKSRRDALDIARDLNEGHCRAEQVLSAVQEVAEEIGVNESPRLDTYDRVLDRLVADTATRFRREVGR